MFDNRPEFLGHRSKIQDHELSDTAGQIKDRVNFVENSLRITREGSGLTVRYASGQVILPNGNVATIVSSILGVPNNSSVFIFVDREGIPRVDSRLPAICVPLARVTSVNGVISTIEDYRHPNLRRVQPSTSALVTFGGQGTTGISTTHNQVLNQGVYYLRDFFVPTGTTCHVLDGTQIYLSGNITILGTLNIYPNPSSHAPQTAYNLTSFGSVGGRVGTGLGSSGGTYSWAVNPGGSGGSGGLLQTATAAGSWGYHGAGGLGGGSITIECAGQITLGATGTIQAFGYAGQNGGNAEDSSPGGTRTNIGNIAIAGSGGGSGGLILLKSLTGILVNAGGTLNVSGGIGGRGYSIAQTNGVRCLGLGGAGGGGGYVVLQSPNNQVSGANIMLNGAPSGGMVSVRASGIAEYLTQPTPGTFRCETPTLFLASGSGGGYGGASKLMTHGQQVEGGVGVAYFNTVTSDPGLLILQNLLPIG